MTEQEALDALAAHLNPNTPRYALPFAEEAAIFLRDHPDVAQALGICQPLPWDEHMPPAQKVEFDDD